MLDTLSQPGAPPVTAATRPESVDAPLTQRVAWLGLEMHLPPDWEVVRHGIRASHGRLVFVDRTRQRMDLCWTESSDAVDLHRLVADHKSSLLLNDPLAIVEPLECAGGWVGLSRVLPNGCELVRAVRWFREAQRLIEVTVIETPGHDPVAPHIMASLEATRAAEARRHCLAGLDVQLPCAARMQEARFTAGQTSFTFRESRRDMSALHRATDITVRRCGLASAWFEGDLRAALAKLTSIHPKRIEPCTVDDAPAFLALSTEHGKRYQSLLRRLRVRQDLVWHAPRLNSVFVVTTLAPRHHPFSPHEVRIGQGAA